MNSSFPVWRLNILSLALLCAISPVYAQNAQSESAPEQELETIVVQAVAQNKTNLATKTEGELRRIPQTLNITNRRKMREMHSRTLGDVMAYLPNVVADNSAGNRAERFLLRGFVSTAYSTDGFVINPTLDRAEGFLDLTDIAQVEVLKGPSSVLFGRSNPGGVINVTSRKPTEDLSIDANLGIGSFETRQFSGSVSGSLDEARQLQGRLSVSSNQDDHFMGAGEAKRHMVSGTLAWQPNEQWVLSATLRHMKQSNPFIRGLPADGRNHKNPIELGLQQRAFYGEPWSRTDTQKTALNLQADYRFNTQTTWRNALLLAQSSASDTGIDFRDIRNVGGVQQLRRRYNQRTEDATNINWTSEISHQTPIGNQQHQFLVGMDLAQGRLHFTRRRSNIANIDLYNPVQGAPRPAAGPEDRNHVRQAQTLGLYLQDQITLNPNWRILLGTRFDYTRDSMRSPLSYATPSETRAFNYRTSERAWSSRIGAVYDINPNLSLFANYSEGFMPNTGTDRDGIPLKPERSRSYEAGMKFEHAPSALTGTLSVFHIDKYNVKTIDPAARDFSVTTGKQSATGAELDVKYSPSENWDINASVAYNHARIARDNQYQVGTGLINAPRTQASLWVNRRFRNSDNAFLNNLTLGVGIRYVGKRLGDFVAQDAAQSRHYHLPAYTVVDLGANYRINDRLSLDVNAQNIFNKFYIAAASTETENNIGTPRSILLNLRYRY